MQVVVAPLCVQLFSAVCFYKASLCVLIYFQQTVQKMFPTPARGQLNRVNEFSLSPFASTNLVSRDSFGSTVPHQPAHSPLYQAWEVTAVVFKRLLCVLTNEDLRPPNPASQQSMKCQSIKVNSLHLGRPRYYRNRFGIATKSWSVQTAPRATLATSNFIFSLPNPSHTHVLSQIQSV